MSDCLLYPLQVDKRDKGTPDDWVPRHPELIRLTGRCAQEATVRLHHMLHSLISHAELHP